MVSLDIPFLDVLFLFFLLIPGFLTYRIGRWVGKVTVPVDRFNKTAYTLISSGVAASILFVGYTAVTRQPLDSIFSATYTAGQLGAGYILILLIASVNGVLAGKFIDGYLRSGIQTRREKTWDIVLDEADQPIEARVVTNDGTEIHGYINIYDSSDHGKDLLVEWPERIIREDGEIMKIVEIGDSVFINEIDISHIYFESEVGTQ